MKTPSEVIPKFIISLEKDKERADYLKNEVFTKITNYIKCKAFDGEVDDPNPVLEQNNLTVAEHFIEKCNSGQLGCYLSHYQVWKYILENNLDLAIVLEDDVKIYKNFNRIINTIYDNLPVKFDYVHLFVHPDKQKIEYLEAKEGDIIPAEDNFGTVAYIISLRGAKRLLKLTQLLKIQAPVDRQINFCVQHNFLKAYMVKRPFLITQGEIMPNRAVYNNSFKSNIWYSTKLIDKNIVNKKFVKPAGFTDDEINDLDKEIENHKKNAVKEDAKENPPVLEIKETKEIKETIETKETNETNETKDELKVDLKEEPVKEGAKSNDVEIYIPSNEEIESVKNEIKEADKNEEDQIVSSIIEKLASID